MKFDDTLREITAHILETNGVPFWAGEPGIGKSSVIRDIARSMDTEAFVLSCNQLADKADLTGARLVTDDQGGTYKQVFFPHDIVAQAIEYARDNPRENPLLVFDEVNRTTPDVTSASLTMITERRLGREEFPPNLRMFAAGNDKGNVTMLDDASLSRFVVLHVDPDAQSLLNHLGDDINHWVRSVLNKNPQMIFAKSKPEVLAADGGGDDDDDHNAATLEDLGDAAEEMRQLTTPRTIDGASRLLNSLSTKQLQEYLQTATLIGDREENVLRELLEGYLGNTDFVTQLISEIADGLASGLNTASGPSTTAPKPSCYKDLKAADSIDAINEIIADLTEKELSSSLVYALHEKADNARMIEQLSAAMENIEPEHIKTLVTLANADAIDQENADALFSTGTKVGDHLQSILSAFLG